VLSARLYDRALAGVERRALGAWRRELLQDVSGVVLEIGAGTGANLDAYGPSVSQLLVADSSVDAVISTLVLCSVRSPHSALAELRRVLRPGGRLHLIEHVAAPPGTVLRRAQAVVAPAWSRLTGGCSVVRPTRDLLAAAGFDVTDVRDDVLPVPVPFVRPLLRGSATPLPGAAGGGDRVSGRHSRPGADRPAASAGAPGAAWHHLTGAEQAKSVHRIRRGDRS
jgi:SAM-dependent methyltransferase